MWGFWNRSKHAFQAQTLIDTSDSLLQAILKVKFKINHPYEITNAWRVAYSLAIDANASTLLFIFGFVHVISPIHFAFYKTITLKAYNQVTY